MLKTSKKILSTIMVVIMVLTAVPLSGFVGLELPAFDLGIKASALASSGQCGPNVTYTYNSTTKELIISGNGPMTNYQSRGKIFPLWNNILHSRVRWYACKEEQGSCSRSSSQRKLPSFSLLGLPQKEKGSSSHNDYKDPHSRGNREYDSRAD